MPSKLPLKTNWHRIKSRLKEKYPSLSESDLFFTEGQEEQLLQRLQTKTHKSRQELVLEIEAMLQPSGTR